MSQHYSPNGIPSTDTASPVQSQYPQFQQQQQLPLQKQFQQQSKNPQQESNHVSVSTPQLSNLKYGQQPNQQHAMVSGTNELGINMVPTLGYVHAPQPPQTERSLLRQDNNALQSQGYYQQPRELPGNPQSTLEPTVPPQQNYQTIRPSLHQQAQSQIPQTQQLPQEHLQQPQQQVLSNQHQQYPSQQQHTAVQQQNYTHPTQGYVGNPNVQPLYHQHNQPEQNFSSNVKDLQLISFD